MAGVLAVVLALVVTALATPAGAYAELSAAHDDMCGGGGGGGLGVQSASIPSPPYDADCDGVSSGSTDPDGSGPVVAGPDNCPTVRNGDQLDTNGDGQGDSCDTDDDGDGVPDYEEDGRTKVDNCRTLANPDQADSDGDGRGDVCETADDDGDGILNDTDNCVIRANPNQANTDGDSQGDACDSDDDDDYVSDASDSCPLASNQDQADRDGDGLGDACDPDSGIIDPDPDPGNDNRAPRVRIGLARVQRLSDLMGGMATSVRCSEACAISGQLRRGRRAVARGTATLAGAGRTWLFLRVRRAVAKRLVGGGGVRATLRLTVTDASGNVTRTRRAVILRR
jgi:hypothetical protein